VVYHLTGHAADLAGARANLAAHLSHNALLRGIADPRIEVWVHLVRRDGQAMSVLPEVDNWYAARFDAAYL
jgi:type IV secretory pathway VirB4 component